MKPLKLRQLLLWQWPGWSLSGLLGLITLFSTIMLLAYSGWFISASALAGIAAIQAGSFNYMRPGAVIRLLAILRTAGRYAERLQSHNTVLKLLKNLRVASFNGMSQQSIAAAAKWSRPESGETLQRLISDIDLLDQFPLRLAAPWLWAIAIGGIFAAALSLCLPSSLNFLLVILALRLLVIPLLFIPIGLGLSRQEVALSGQRRQVNLIGLQLLTTLLTFGRWSDYAAKLAATDQAISQRQKQLQLSVLASELLAQCLHLVGLMLLAIQGSQLVLADSLNPAILVGLLLGWLGLNEAFQVLSQLHLATGYSLAARDRTNQLLANSAEPNQQSQRGETPAPDAKVTLKITQLSCGFKPEQPILAQQDQTFEAGDVVLLKGRSGAGKSCLLQTLAADLSPLSGSILFKGVEQQQLAANDWHRNVAYLTQRPTIFQLSIAADLRLAAPKASDKELVEVLQLVGLKPWLDKQSQGLRTVLGQYGVGLSGGELRRFALARMMLTRAPVLLLDEPFSGLDQATTERLIQALVEWQHDGILIIASHQQLDHLAFNRHWSLD
ncbi:amino acid ABC transporter ATP-binding/permease protein [Agarivorans gilvus]|uniref:Cysteine/glutathione ABC transporter ATP-binding protein/permease CydC n=2 Tax=Agarivorans gilvus TaxID=680279 RepID=A0ABQ1I071_9ALTE|nr:ATP-binding cassette domain-containing protein [Agarivorans gilvus]GGA99614.1 cysteine/glutathione ABC transporter ATP-binding protein/permease CydC [Agarivorans gilvus]